MFWGAILELIARADTWSDSVIKMFGEKNERRLVDKFTESVTSLSAMRFLFLMFSLRFFIFREVLIQNSDSKGEWQFSYFQSSRNDSNWKFDQVKRIQIRCYGLRINSGRITSSHSLERITNDFYLYWCWSIRKNSEFYSKQNKWRVIKAFSAGFSMVREYLKPPL